MTHSLKITVHDASRLEDVERFGKNDPYAQVSLDLKTFQKTKTVNNAGKQVTWNQTLTIDNFDPQAHPELYVEVLDSETLADEVIGFAAIPLSQVISAQGHAIRGRFELFNDDAKQKGEIVLTIAVVAAGQAEPHHTAGTEVRGTSHVVSAHQARIKALERKEAASDAASLAAAGALAMGAKAILDGNKRAAAAAATAHEQ
ncbi:hypothetical protein BGX29_005348 [Mortierella sp. GBA35]|nr:hypothetical protein BGX29_005348 [Mortierella sp. GBA35]